MTKAELISIIGENAGGVTKAQLNYVYDMTWETIVRALEVDGKFTVANFGTFVVRDRKARKARNPRTGETVDVAASKKLAFRPATTLKAKFTVREEKAAE